MYSKSWRGGGVQDDVGTFGVRVLGCRSVGALGFGIWGTLLGTVCTRGLRNL